MLRLRAWAQRIPLLAFVVVVVTFRWNRRNAASRPAEGQARTHSEPEPSRSSLSQAIGMWAAILASLAAVGGLVFTGFSVRYQAEQTGLQVAASKAQTDEQNKQQAELVNVWASNEFSPAQVLVTVSNRSQDPVYQFRIYIAFATSRLARVYGAKHLEQFSSVHPGDV